MRIRQLIDEIKTLKTLPTHKSTMDICRMLENNRRLFIEKIDEESFDQVYSNFEKLSQSHSKDYDTSSYIREYEQAHHLLSFYFDRIL